MNKLRKLVNSKFNYVVNKVISINNFCNEDILHNLYRIKFVKNPKYSYNGNSSCGAACLILGKLLLKNNYDVKMYLYKFGYGSYYEDHVYLKYKNIIIDPTYKQFYNTNLGKGMSEYDNYLYNDLPPFFVGTHSDLNSLHNSLSYRYKKEFNYNLDNDNLRYWNGKKDITNLFNNERSM